MSLSGNQQMKMNNIKIVGEWDGEKIWRYKTAEEKLQEEGIEESTVKLFITLSENGQRENNKRCTV